MEKLMASATILLCDDEELIRWSLREYLGGKGYRILEAEDGEAGLERIAAHGPDLVLLDLRMPKKDGLTVLRELRAAGNDVPVVMLTAYGALESAIEATRLGADAYMTKPFDLEDVAETVARTLDEYRMRHEVRSIDGVERETGRYHTMLGESAPMRRVFDRLRRLESIDAPTVMISGESGTGKDLVARAIHARGPRSSRPFMEVDCTAIPDGLFESTLFGHEKGAFTDARTQHRGLFESAGAGVVFLDEIGEIGMPMQAKLLRALENRKFKRVGGTQDIPLDAAIIVATNRDLRREVDEGRFREDLYYRLAVVPIQVPPLRERGEDIGILCENFVRHFNGLFGRAIEGLSEEAMELLRTYAWPGNVRELRNAIERIVILHEGQVIRAAELPREVVHGARASFATDCPFLLPDEGVDLEAVERGLMEQALERTEGNQSAAARLLGLTRYAFRYRAEKHGLR
ncbi:MAG: sigma-54-dependent Fis family transcriptional regulator [Deltaproteobacteria bacterium]|nr:MAG: sigma-54-dependent Fis family transcriptional regulator [Deltaproteobacteria bacterium]